MSQASPSVPAASTHTGLLITLTIIAALGGLLFGYDSAVISGATDSIKQNFVAPLHLEEGARLSLEFADGRVGVAADGTGAPAMAREAKPATAKRTVKPVDQGTLF